MDRSLWWFHSLLHYVCWSNCRNWWHFKSTCLNVFNSCKCRSALTCQIKPHFIFRILFPSRSLSIKNRFLRTWTGMSINIAHNPVGWVRSHQTVQIRAFVYSRRVSLSMKIVQCLEKGFTDWSFKLARDFQNVLDPVRSKPIWSTSVLDFPFFRDQPVWVRGFLTLNGSCFRC